MIKRWSKFNEEFKRGDKLAAKIEILKELSLQLTDLGLSVEIWSGTYKDDLGFGPSSGASKCIIMMIQDIDGILDDENYYENTLYDKPEIIEFEKDLISHGMRPRSKRRVFNKVYFFFDKQGKMTDTELLNMYRFKKSE